MDDNGVDNSEIICVEVQENENGEIIYVEKIENEDYVVMDDDFCVVECEIATSGENNSSSISNDNSNRSNGNEPVEVIFLQNFDENGDENPIILKREVEETGNMSDENSNSSQTIASGVKSVRTYVKKHSDFVKIEPVSEDKYMQLQTPIKNCSTTRTVAQTQKLNALLQVASGKVNQMSKSPNLQEEIAKVEHVPNALVPVRRLNAFSQQRPKLWSHRVDRRNFDKTNLLSNITNITSQDSVSRQKQLYFKHEDSSVSMFEVNSVEVQTGVKRKVKDLPYQCEMCDKSFRQASSLVIHLKVHAGKYADNCVLS